MRSFVICVVLFALVFSSFSPLALADCTNTQCMFCDTDIEKCRAATTCALICVRCPDGGCLSEGKA